MNSPVHRENPYQPNIESTPTAGRRANAAERRFWACHLHRLACRKCAAFAPTLPLQNPRNTRAFPSSSATAPPSARARRAAPTRGRQSGRVRALCAASRLEKGAPISAHCQARQALRMALADTVAPSSSRTSCVSCQRSDSSSVKSDEPTLGRLLRCLKHFGIITEINPTREPDQMAFLSPKTLTRVRRNNLARYISGSYGRGNGWRISIWTGASGMGLPAISPISQSTR